MSNHGWDRLLKHLEGSVKLDGDHLSVFNEKTLPEKMDVLIHEAVFGEPDVSAAARWLIWETARAVGIRPASIHDLYIARGRGRIEKAFTVPAMNLRMLAYDSARAVFRAARTIDCGAFIFEIARSEMVYTDQRPAEYVSAVLAAALREGYRGPVFIQGDHFQAGVKKYAADPEAETQAIRDLIIEAVAEGFYNIDIDTSTLVDISLPKLADQQKKNFELCAAFTRFIRDHEPAGVAISVGGEIGEVGHQNSTVEDLDAFMTGYDAARGTKTGISKISIQTGTSHGGVVLPDGSLAQVAIDFDALRALSARAREAYGMGGAVQHGASTLPDTAFHRFVEAGTCEVHLATAFQSLIMDHLSVPESLRLEMYDWLKKNAVEERKPKDSDAQFFYKARKKAVGPFKKRFWELPKEARDEIGMDLERKFQYVFEQLGMARTTDIVNRFIKAPEIHKPRPAGGARKTKTENVDGLAD
jgi:fructose-bisphosphate aldolase class II